MTLLRMLAFRPAGDSVQVSTSSIANPKRSNAPAKTSAPAISGRAAARAAIAEAAAQPEPSPVPQRERAEHKVAAMQEDPPAPAGASALTDLDAERWLDLLAGVSLRGLAKELAAHAAFTGYSDGVLRLSLSADDEFLKTPAAIKQLAEALAPAFGAAPQIRFEAAAAAGDTLRQRHERARDARHSAAEDAFLNDPDVQRLIGQGARVVPDSIRPLDD